MKTINEQAAEYAKSISKNDTIVPVTKEERFSSLPPDWMIYEVLKWGDWYISPVGPNGEAPSNEAYVFVTMFVKGVVAHVPITKQVIKNDPAFAAYIVSVHMKKSLAEYISKNG